MRLWWMLTIVGGLQGAVAEAQGVCVANHSDTELYFVAQDSARRAGWLAPGETLCAPIQQMTAAQHMNRVVSVFADPQDIEGCSKPVPQGRGYVLLSYVAFDRCVWDLLDDGEESP